jgi:hypothetical protein
MESVMRVPVFAASLLLTTAVLSGSVLAAVSVPIVAPAPAAKVSCPCDCPAARPKHAARPVSRRVARRRPRGTYYNYASAAPIGRQEWHGPWRQVPNEPQGGNSDPALRVDTYGWNGGVGSGADGGGGGAGFVDGYGQVHFASGGGVQNGPTYNGYNQSFQYNPSVAGPFQPRLMGGIAPPPAGSRGR